MRSAFGAEDGGESSLAGWFTSRLGVRNAEFADAVDDVRASGDRRDGTFRLDVLVMAMVDADTPASRSANPAPTTTS